MNDCKHMNLKAVDEYSSVDIFREGFDPDYMIYRKYRCQDCQDLVIVLQAVVEKR